MLRKSLLAAAVLIAISASASATVIFTAGASDAQTGSFNPTDNNGAGPGPVTVSFASKIVDFGVFSVDQKYTVTYTFLGTEAGYIDHFVEMATGFGSFVNKPKAANTVGDTLVVTDGPGNLKFQFDSVSPASVAKNGDIFLPFANPSWGVLRGATSTVGVFDYILGFNDPSRSDRDFDDMVVGMSLKAVPAIPEPSTYALMLAGLASIGFLVRRRRSN